MWNLLEGTVPILAPSGYVAEIGEDCVGCGTCLDEHAYHFNAISMKRDAAKGEPLDLDKLLIWSDSSGIHVTSIVSQKKVPLQGSFRHN